MKIKVNKYNIFRIDFSLHYSLVLLIANHAASELPENVRKRKNATFFCSVLEVIWSRAVLSVVTKRPRYAPDSENVGRLS